MSLCPRRGRMDARRTLPQLAWWHQPRQRRAQRARTAPDRRRTRPCTRTCARPDPGIEQSGVVRARSAPVSLLRKTLQPPVADPGPCDTALARRTRHLGKRGFGMLPLQFAQGRPHAAAGVDAAAGGALSSELDRAPDPEQSQHPRGSDGIPENASTEEPSRHFDPVLIACSMAIPLRVIKPCAAHWIAGRDRPAARGFAVTNRWHVLKHRSKHPLNSSIA